MPLSRADIGGVTDCVRAHSARREAEGEEGMRAGRQEENEDDNKWEGVTKANGNTLIASPL